MKKNILILSTSPRKNGNSEMLAREFARGAEEAGHNVELLSLHDKTIGFCKGCLACQKTQRCVIHDDADAIVRKMKDAEVIAFYEANPVYALPGKDIEAVFKKSDFSVAFTCFFDETARRCDLVLPNALGLERYDDVAEPFSYGKFVYALVRPVAEPLYQARPAGAWSSTWPTSSASTSAFPTS